MSPMLIFRIQPITFRCHNDVQCNALVLRTERPTHIRLSFRKLLLAVVLIKHSCI